MLTRSAGSLTRAHTPLFDWQHDSTREQSPAWRDPLSSASRDQTLAALVPDSRSNNPPRSLPTLWLSSQSLLYGLGHAWPKFNPVNDTIRGGRSESHFATSNPSFATFSGVLDITALGGAGFASQSTTFAPDRLSLPAGAYSGLSLSLSLPSTRYDDEEKPDSTPTNYVLVLKNTKPETRPDGRRESVTSYEFAFDTKDVLTQEKSATGHRVVVRVDAEWNAFEATYRGRPQKDAPPLDPSCIYELSRHSLVASHPFLPTLTG